MKAYGLTNYKQRGCCPGHDSYPSEGYGTPSAKRHFRKTTKINRRRGRRIVKNNLKIEAKSIN